MDPNKLEVLNECLELVAVLERKGELHRDKMQGALGGELLTGYLKTEEKSEQAIRELKQSLLLLQADALSGMSQSI